jgi:hypothetical protein
VDGDYPIRFESLLRSEFVQWYAFYPMTVMKMKSMLLIRFPSLGIHSMQSVYE